VCCGALRLIVVVRPLEYFSLGLTISRVARNAPIQIVRSRRNKDLHRLLRARALPSRELCGDLP
jgi:hypothetical protein